MHQKENICPNKKGMVIWNPINQKWKDSDVDILLNKAAGHSLFRQQFATLAHLWVTFNVFDHAGAKAN